MTFPEWIVPMAATLTYERFSGPEWVFERKFDGIRLLSFKNGSDIKLYSRNRLLQDLPPIRDAIARLPAQNVILDGEELRHPRLMGVREDKLAREVVRENP